ncbi:hypothetical protein IT575_07075 [bacterium]|nr:hypothetical protein [bacterium]
MFLLLVPAAPAATAETDAPGKGAVEPDWGRPRDPDTIRFDYRLPDIAGWQQRFLGDWSSEIVADEQYLYVVDGAGLSAYRLDNAALFWSCADIGQAHFMEDFCAVSKDLLLLHDGKDLAAVDKASGRLLWRREGLAPVAAGWNWVWATRASEYPGWGDEVQGEDLLLLYALDGSTKAEFPYSQVSTSSGQITSVGTGYWPDADLSDPGWTSVYFYADGALRACNVEGESWHWDCGGPGKRVLLHPDANSLLVEEYLDFGLGIDSIEAMAGTNLDEAGLAAAWQRLGPPLRVSRIDYLSGQPRWQIEPSLGSSSGVFQNCVLAAGGAWFVLRRPGWVTDKDAGWSTSSHALDLYDCASGEFMRTLLAADADAIPRDYYWQRYGQVLTVLLEDDTGFNLPRRQSLRRFDLLSGEALDITLPRELRLTNLIFHDGYIAGTADCNPAFGQYGESFGLLLRCDLDGADGQLKVGAPQRSGFPQFDRTLAERFCASADPLADDVLMRALVADGRSSIVQLYERFGNLSQPQRQALLELCLYVQQRSRNEDADTYLRPLSELLEKVLQRNAAVLSVDEISRWMADQRLARYKQQFVGLLALKGGPGAAALLEPIYADLDRQDIDPPQPPYKPRTSSWQLTSQSRPWSIDNPAGGIMTAFVDSALTGSVVWIGEDQDNDGAYEAVWPTPFNDVFNRYYLPHGMQGLEAPLGPLGLQLLGDELLVTHHQPSMETEQREGFSIETMTGAVQVQDRISLAELRRDSDGDGLSDQTEAQLFTDPLSADSDADGLPDRSDAAPNVNPAGMGRLERGVCRAIHFARRMEPWLDTEPLPDDNWGMPARASYILTAGCGPVLLRDPAAYCICLSSAEQQVSYQAMHDHAFPVDTNISVVSIDARGQRSDAETGGHRKPYDYTGEYVVQINYFGSGTEVELKDVGGELYPTNICGGWIS